MKKETRFRVVDGGKSFSDPKINKLNESSSLDEILEGCNYVIDQFCRNYAGLKCSETFYFEMLEDGECGRVEFSIMNKKRFQYAGAAKYYSKECDCFLELYHSKTGFPLGRKKTCGITVYAWEDEAMNRVLSKQSKTFFSMRMAVDEFCKLDNGQVKVFRPPWLFKDVTGQPDKTQEELHPWAG